jgi:hypothetical protein
MDYNVPARDGTLVTSQFVSSVAEENKFGACKYAYEYPTRCNDNALVLLQDLYMFRVPAVPIIRSTILQLAC